MLDPTRFFFSSPFLFNPSNISAIVPTSPLFIGGTAANHQPTTATTSVITGVATKPTTSASSSSSFSIADILDNKIKNNNNNVGTDYNSGVAAYIKAIKDEDGDDDDGSSTPNSGGIGSGSMTTGGGKKPRKARTIFTDKQLQELETTFDKQKYLSVQDRMDLAHRMGLSDTQVKTWYQNRRTKWKRQTAVGMELLSEPTNFAVVQQLFRTNPYWTSYMAAHQQMQPSNYAAARGGGMWPIGGSETLSPANFGMLLPQQQQTSTAATSLTSSPKLSPPPSAS